MTKKIKFGICATIAVLFLSSNYAFAQFQGISFSGNSSWRTQANPLVGRIGIGNFPNGTNLPSVLTINANLIPSPTGEVFRTTSNATGTNVNAWRMFTGTGEGNEKFALYTNSGTSINPNDVYIQASKLGSNILFNTGGSFTRMIITDGKVTAPNMQTGLVGIGNNFLNPNYSYKNLVG